MRARVQRVLPHTVVFNRDDLLFFASHQPALLRFSSSLLVILLSVNLVLFFSARKNLFSNVVNTRFQCQG